ncbi:CLUMA_CG012949, isoform A [Clunio marinus]|uniref:CLUMA_CG012949, isoform A n=1 Tax=Clunio marinus TaxID=568069 RepID=A0A1J1IKM9_9DIPT|nr:CLUMA_CG012949, isoform A [Clunio marinus]
MDSDGDNSSQVDEKDILDSSVFGPNAKLFSCELCDQKFTNKLKIAVHWSVNHGYKLCALCSNYAFRYDTDKMQHELQHLPFGCSSCSFEFNSVYHTDIEKHYKDAHKSFLCMFCSSVIEPYSKFAIHFEMKHNIVDKRESFLDTSTPLHEFLKDSDTGFFQCKLCNKKKKTDLLFGHFIFYHGLSIHAFATFIVKKDPEIRVNGSAIGSIDNELSEGGNNETTIKEKRSKKVCGVCENQITADSNIHDVFCQGYIMCNQKECEQLFQDETSYGKHLDSEHPTSNCKFGCRDTNLKASEIEAHLQNSHDIVECSLCYIINSSGNYKNHLRDKHSVNLLIYEKARNETSLKLYRVDDGSNEENKKQVLCNFCDHNITKDIREFSFINHYQDRHEINISAIIRNLDKNPIPDLISSKTEISEKDCLENFEVILETQTEGLIETDFDTSKVYCIGADSHLEKKPRAKNQTRISCEFCKKTTFDASCRLYEHLNDTHGFKLLNVIDECDTCQVKIQKSETISDEDSKDFNLSLVCPLDESFHLTKDNFKSHMEFAHLDQTLSIDKIMYKCFECNFAYNKLEDMRQHFKEAHPENKVNYCRICRVRLDDLSDNSVHFKLNHADDIKPVEHFTCKLCDKKYKGKHRAKTHYLNAHVKKKKYVRKMIGFKCQHKACKETFNNKDDRKMHLMIAHPDEKLFACKQCPLKFSTKSGLFGHNMKHKNIVLTCSFCQKTFIRRDSYKEHLLIHSGVRQKCSFCEKTFVQRSNLIRHERIHLNDKPYKCNFCEKTFSDKGACTSHENVHTKAEHSNCEVCGKHFAKKQKLKYHMRTHTLENVFTCDVCNQIFTQSYSLRKHKESHLKKGRSDKCYECDRVFKSIKARDKHMSSYHAETFPEAETLIETKIQCTMCNMKDFTMDTIKEHLSKKHNIDNPNEWESFVREVEFEMETEDSMK